MSVFKTIIYLIIGYLLAMIFAPTKIKYVDLPPIIQTVAEYVYIAPDVNDERTCMAQAIYAEARGESLYGQKAVAQVIMNRVYDYRFPDTICEVVNYKPYDTYHFSYLYKSDPNFYETARVFANMQVTYEEIEARDLAYEIADRAIAGLDVLPTSSLNYHSVSISPVWADKLEVHKTIDGHIFYTGF